MQPTNDDCPIEHLLRANLTAFHEINQKLDAVETKIINSFQTQHDAINTKLNTIINTQTDSITNMQCILNGIEKSVNEIEVNIDALPNVIASSMSENVDEKFMKINIDESAKSVLHLHDQPQHSDSLFTTKRILIHS